jgi:hypothetical protein
MLTPPVFFSKGADVVVHITTLDRITQIAGLTRIAPGHIKILTGGVNEEFSELLTRSTLNKVVTVNIRCFPLSSLHFKCDAR